jgi:hypothetical protein
MRSDQNKSPMILSAEHWWTAGVARKADLHCSHNCTKDAMTFASCGANTFERTWFVLHLSQAFGECDVLRISDFLDLHQAFMFALTPLMRYT